VGPGRYRVYTPNTDTVYLVFDDVLYVIAGASFRITCGWVTLVPPSGCILSFVNETYINMICYSSGNICYMRYLLHIPR